MNQMIKAVKKRWKKRRISKK